MVFCYLGPTQLWSPEFLTCDIQSLECLIFNRLKIPELLTLDNSSLECLIFYWLRIPELLTFDNSSREYLKFNKLDTYWISFTFIFIRENAFDSPWFFFINSKMYLESLLFFEFTHNYLLNLIHSRWFGSPTIISSANNPLSSHFQHKAYFSIKTGGEPWG